MTKWLVIRGKKTAHWFTPYVRDRAGILWINAACQRALFRQERDLDPIEKYDAMDMIRKCRRCMRKSGQA